MATEGEQKRYRTFRVQHGTEFAYIKCPVLPCVMGVYSAMLHAVPSLTAR